LSTETNQKLTNFHEELYTFVTKESVENIQSDIVEKIDNLAKMTQSMINKKANFD